MNDNNRLHGLRTGNLNRGVAWIVKALDGKPKAGGESGPHCSQQIDHLSALEHTMVTRVILALAAALLLSVISITTIFASPLGSVAIALPNGDVQHFSSEDLGFDPNREQVLGSGEIATQTVQIDCRDFLNTRGFLHQCAGQIFQLRASASAPYVPVAFYTAVEDSIAHITVRCDSLLGIGVVMSSCLTGLLQLALEQESSSSS